MTTTLSRDGTNIHPYRLSADELLAIGRLVRACAEIDEIADLYLRELASIKPWQSIILLGRMPASARLKLAGTFASTQGKDAIDLHKECFDNDAYKNVVKFRNTVVHGILLGKTDDGDIAFEVQETAGTDENRFLQTVNAYQPVAFDALATIAEEVIPQLEECLKLGALREKHRSQRLSPHPKHHRADKQKAKPARPRRS